MKIFDHIDCWITIIVWLWILIIWMIFWLLLFRFNLQTLIFNLKMSFCVGSNKRGWDRCSWKGQLVRTRSWKVLSWKVQNEIGKIEVGKLESKLESSWPSWKVRAEVEKWLTKLESLNLTWKDSIKFPISKETF